MDQKIITSAENYKGLDEWITMTGAKKLLLVCDDSLRYQKAFNEKLEKIAGNGVNIVRFSDFRPNPLYGSVVDGVELFREGACDAIIAVGGGSAIDVAKCIKLFSNMSGDGANGAYIDQDIVPNPVPFLAVPTTAGTGSEATRYAVIYYDDKKQSVTSDGCIPETVLLDPDCLKTLPIYQKKATMMDAFCHAIESFWSVNSTEESREYSRASIIGVLKNMDGYLENTDEGNAGMLMAAHTAGKAINITQTTAGHAMCYKISSLFGVAHGHAAILCDRILYSWMVHNTDKCIDPRGEGYLKRVFDDIAEAMGCVNAEAGAEKLIRIFDSLELEVPGVSNEQYEILRTNVNPVRLRNNPVALDEWTIDKLYHEILR